MKCALNHVRFRALALNPAWFRAAMHPMWYMAELRNGEFILGQLTIVRLDNRISLRLPSVSE